MCLNPPVPGVTVTRTCANINSFLCLIDLFVVFCLHSQYVKANL